MIICVMKLKLYFFSHSIVSSSRWAHSCLRQAEEPDQTAIMNELRRREEKVGRLSIEEQLKVRAAQQKAVEDAAVKAALRKPGQSAG